MKMRDKCVLCGEKIVGFGNNAEPLAKGKCCDKCNYSKVIPARLKESRKSASQYNKENQDSVASQHKNGNHTHIASQEELENQFKIASQGYQENHSNLASHVKEEDQESLVSQEQKENHPSLASHKDKENHKSLASHEKNENHQPLASQERKENQESIASQKSIENQSDSASQGYQENQENIASHSDIENHKSLASQLKVENQKELASQRKRENHSYIASQTEGENQQKSASQDERENQKPPAQNILAEMGRLIAGSYYDHQEIRITEFNRIRDIIRRKLENIPMTGGVEQKKKDEEKFQEHFVDKKIPEYLNQLVEQNKLTTKEHEYIVKVLEVQKNAEKYEKEYQKLMKEFVEMQPIYNTFLKHIRGISTVLSANLIKEFGYCENARYISSLWKYSGMHVVEGEAPKRRKGQKLDFSIKRRTMVWKIGDSFVKQRTPFYRDIYDKEKERQLRLLDISQNAKENQENIASHLKKEDQIKLASQIKREDQNAPANYPKNRMHCELRARRKMVKIFLAHYWEVGKELTSQKEGENHTFRASQDNKEDQDKLASHGEKGNHLFIASQYNKEDHKRIASRVNEENNRELASQETEENQLVVASQEAKENQKNVASHLGGENQKASASQIEEEKPLLNSEPYASSKLGHKHISNWREAVSKSLQMKAMKLEEKNKK